MVQNMFGLAPQKPKVLLLGVSFPSVAEQMEKHGYPEDILHHNETSMDQVVECVKRGILTEMDARDLARCIGTEKVCDVDAYTVSREIGAVYRDDRHIHSDFNARNFCNKLKDAFGDDIQFSQVILDYYWMPTGWLVTRWAKTLFQQTLPDLVRYNMLSYPIRRRNGRRKEGSIDEGVVYLPFCAHVCKELVGAIEILKKYYAISFVNKSELSGHSLWKGTMSIDADVMQHELGKRLDQEEVYCTFKPKDIYESMEDAHVRKDDVMRVLLAIKDYENIRFVRLQPLRQHEPPSVMKERLVKPEVGGFIGLDYKLAEERKKQQAKALKERKLQEQRERKLALREKERKLQELKNERKRIKEKERRRLKKEVEKENRKKVVKKATKKRVKGPLSLDKKESTTSKFESESESELDMTYFYPGPAADLDAYIAPEAYGPHFYGEARKKRPKKEKEKSINKSRIGLSPHEFLRFNPRRAPLPEKVERQRSGRLLTNDNSQAKSPGSLLTDLELLELPSSNKVEDEIEGACDLIRLKDRGFDDLSYEVKGDKELICFEIPSKDIPSPLQLSPECKRQLDKWKFDIANHILNSYDENSTNVMLIYRFETMENIITWLKNRRHHIFDLSGSFNKIHSKLGAKANDDIFKTALFIEKYLYEEAKTKLCLPVRNEQAGANKFDNPDLFASILRYLEDKRSKNDPTGEFVTTLKSMPGSLTPKSNEERAKEMVFRIVMIRDMIGDKWYLQLESNRDKNVSGLESKGLPGQSKSNSKKRKKSSKLSPQKEASPAKERLSKATKSSARKKQAIAEILPSRKERKEKSNNSRRVQSFYSHLDLLEVFSQDIAQMDSFFNNVSLKLGYERAIELCSILNYLITHNPILYTGGEIEYFQRLLPPELTVWEAACQLEHIFFGLRERWGENWRLSMHEAGMEFLVGDILNTIKSLRFVSEEFVRLTDTLSSFHVPISQPEQVIPFLNFH